MPAGLRRRAMVQQSPTNYFFVAEWDSYDAIADARSLLIENLNAMRPLLEDLGGGLGPTFAVSGEASPNLHRCPCPRRIRDRQTPRVYCHPAARDGRQGT